MGPMDTKGSSGENISGGEMAEQLKKMFEAENKKSEEPSESPNDVELLMKKIKELEKKVNSLDDDK